jgi:Lysylphosphatidylglycerol synthase TM region
MQQSATRGSQKKSFTPLGIVFAIAGLLLFVYFVRKAGVTQIVVGIKNLGVGFVLIIVISAMRHIVRSLSWMLCFDGEERLSFRDALRGRLMGDALGNIVGFANFLVSEPAKPAMVRDRVPLMAGVSAIAIENIFYAISVCIFIFSGAAALLLSFDLPKPLRIAGVATLAIVPFVIVLLYFFVRRQYRFISAGLGFLHRRGMSERWLANGRVVEDRVYGFYRRSGSRFIPILLLEACFHLAGVLEIYTTLVFISPAQPPTLFTAFILESVNRVINLAFKFIPLRMGVDEAGTGKVAAILQFTQTTGVTLAIIRKGRDVFWTIVGVILLVQRGWSLRSAANAADHVIEDATQNGTGAEIVPADGPS